MKNIASARLIEARARLGLNQKDAAEALGISQALLSHYENGIRDCNTEFLVRAGALYDVSTDYLLGLSAKPRDDGVLADEIPAATDGSRTALTVLRALVQLERTAERISPEEAEKIVAVYAMTLYRLLGELPCDMDTAIEREKVRALSTAAEALIAPDFGGEAFFELPPCAHTAVAMAEDAVRAALGKF
ncbi:MAG: helix-turn-helix transcriptional regulator [Clostridia bacterium]|nr:helix-turn-helix transcriptional regulator [Clostridia bacterium]